MFFALIHELGHLIVGAMLGVKTESILIFPFGFAIKFKDVFFNDNLYNKKRNSTEIKKMIIAIAGPAVNILYIFFISVSNLKFKNTDTIIFSNILIAVFNLLPIYPLDGGRILKYLFNIFFDERRSYIYIQNVSYIFMFIFTFFASIFMYYIKNMVLFFAIIYLWMIVIKEDKIIKMKIKMENHIQFPGFML